MNPRDMVEEDVGAVVGLVSAAMNSDEGRWARTTMERHFAMRRAGICDGRRYIVFEEGGAAVAICGLHNYEWGPPENVWLGWLAVEPGVQGKGYGRRIIDYVEGLAREMGYRKLFIETYEGAVFRKAVRFYERSGYAMAGSIANYLPDGESMLVFVKEL